MLGHANTSPCDRESILLELSLNKISRIKKIQSFSLELQLNLPLRDPVGPGPRRPLSVLAPMSFGPYPPRPYPMGPLGAPYRP